MKKMLLLMFAFLILVLSVTSFADETKPDQKVDQLSGTIKGLVADVLMTDQLAIAEGVEVVVSHIVVPPNTTLPVHWHHGEEFVYVLEGSAVLWLKGKPEISMKKGDIYKIPLKETHTAKTTDEQATVIVFRVHEEGKPVRVLADE